MKLGMADHVCPCLQWLVLNQTLFTKTAYQGSPYHGEWVQFKGKHLLISFLPTFTMKVTVNSLKKEFAS